MANLKTALAKANEERDQAREELELVQIQRDDAVLLAIRLLREVREPKVSSAVLEALNASNPQAFEGWDKRDFERLCGPGGRDPIFFLLHQLIVDGNGALELVAREREHQLTQWTRTHDDEHARAELAVVAAELLVHGTDESVSTVRDEADLFGLVEKHGGDRVRSLTIACALALAELERVLRRELDEYGKVVDVEKLRGPAGVQPEEPAA